MTEQTTEDPFAGCSWRDDRGVEVMNVSQARHIVAARLAAVEAIHRRIDYADTGDAYCAHDNQWWPCATAAALAASPSGVSA